MKKTSNGFATKGDLKKLEGKMDHRFEQVDKRFGKIDKKLGKIDMRLGIFHFEWDAWKQDALTEFNSRWITRIDPILADIERHQEQEIIWAEENRQTQIAVRDNEIRIGKIMQWIEERRSLEPQLAEQNRQREEKVDQLTANFKQQENKIDHMGKILDQVAKKIGV